MPKAFRRIPASALEAALDADNIPQELEEALRAAIKAAREDEQLGGEAPIEVFITDDSYESDNDEDEDSDA